MDGGGAGLCCIRIHQSLLNMGIESKVLVLKKTTKSPEVYQYGNLIEKIARIPSKICRLASCQITDRNKIINLMRTNHTAYSLPVSPIDVTKHKLISWADIIHLHWVNNYVDLPSFFQKVRKPVIWTLHDENLFYGIAHHHKSILPNNPLEIKYRDIKRRAIQNAANLTIVFLSKMMYDKFGGEDFIGNRKKIIINNAVNANSFVPHNREKMRDKYNVDREKTVFAIMANDIGDPNKGLKVLSESLCEIDPDRFEILAIGGNPQNVHYPLVHSVGNISSQSVLSELLSSADYFAMPSYQEAFPQSPMEAMACGLPVVAFPVSGTYEMMNENNGVVCDDFTKKSLKGGITRLLSKKYDANCIRQDMINRFAPEIIAQKYFALYNSII